MDIKQMREAKQEMEEEIRLAAVAAICKFTNKTGAHPSSVRVNLVEVNEFGGRISYMVCDVKTDVPI